jgi:hypothetical protein
MVCQTLCLTGLRLSKAEKHSRWPASFPDVVWAGSGKYSIYLPNRSNFIVNTQQWLLLVTLTKCQAYAAPVIANADISGYDTNAAMYIKDMLGSNGIPKAHSGVILRGSLIPPNGHTHTTDKDSRRVVSVLGIRDGEIVYAGRNLAEAERNARRLTVWPAHPARSISGAMWSSKTRLPRLHRLARQLADIPHPAQVLNRYRQRSSLAVPSDATPSSPRYGRRVCSPPVQGRARLPALSELDVAGCAWPRRVYTNGLLRAGHDQLPRGRSF